MPLGDWQFYVVTIIAIAALVVVTRPFWPRRRKRSKRVDLTIGRKEITPQGPKTQRSGNRGEEQT